MARATRDVFDERVLRRRWMELGGCPLVKEGLRLAAAGEISYAEVLKYERAALIE